MKISDIVKGTHQQDQHPTVVAVRVQAAPEQQHTDNSELIRMRQIAGLLGSGETEYSNSPEEKYAPIGAVLASGDDLNKSKHPADIRTNAPSMYPGHQHHTGTK